MANTSYDDRLEQLLETAAQVFAAKGYHSTTMRDLARVTGMSLAGMYYYVRGKDELLFLIQERCFTRVLEGATTAIAEGEDDLDRLSRFITHHVTFFAQHMSEMKVLSHEADVLRGERHAAIDRLKRRYVDMLQALIAAVDDTRGPDARVSAYALFGMMNWIYNWYDPTGPVAPDALAHHFTQLFLHGVVPTPTTISQGG